MTTLLTTAHRCRCFCFCCCWCFYCSLFVIL